ncbi:MAG: hypothetical protein H6706_02565 [Myxococcales bacterium]|nr:hypothetical protein [Myxococcales bacterium]
MRRALLALALVGCGDEAGPGLDAPAPPTRQLTDAGAPLPDAALPAPDAAEAPSEDPDAAAPADAAHPDAPADAGLDAAVVDDVDAAPADDPPPGPARSPLPPIPVYSHGECPALVGGSTADTAVVDGFATGDQVRSFRLMVPPGYDGSRPLPVIFAWHWLNASSASFVREAELESAVEELDFIAVLPDALRNANGDKAYFLSWPFAEVWGVEGELRFFDDLLACVNDQLNVDRDRVYGIGVSAGGLWLTSLAMTDRAEHFASIEVLSGGLGDMLGVWRMEYAPQPNKYPALVVWGGPTDWLALSFHDASMRLRDALVADDHFVVECTHDAGHGVPPVEPSEEHTKFRFLWSFMFDHPRSLPVGASPYLADGLPDFFPPWCRLAGD